jgi:hypothetical protein
MWDLWWTKLFHLVNTYHSTIASYTFIYHRLCVIWAIAASLNDAPVLKLSNATDKKFRLIMTSLKDILLLSTLRVMPVTLFLCV